MILFFLSPQRLTLRLYKVHVDIKQGIKPKSMGGSGSGGIFTLQIVDCRLQGWGKNARRFA